MGAEDRRQYFIVASVILEIVAPLFRKKLEHVFTNLGFLSLQDFLNSQPIKHIMFHLHVKNVWCCVDRVKCISRGTLPLIHSQWNLFYSIKPGHSCTLRDCHCKYTASPVPLSDLDITVTSLILNNCCNLGTGDINVIKELRKLKNNYLSHNTTGGLNEAEYITIWTDLTTFVLQLDHTKHDDLARIERRPFDEVMCNDYTRCVLDVFKRLDEIDANFNTRFDRQDAQLDRIEGMLRNVTGQRSEACSVQQGLNQRLQKRPHKLGQLIFNFSHQIDIASVFRDKDIRGPIWGVEMMDDGRIVFCIFDTRQLLVCNIDGSQEHSYTLQSEPLDVKSVNKSTVAVTLPSISCIELHNINKKLKLQTIQTGGSFSIITDINNKLAFAYERQLLIIDPQTDPIIQFTNTDIGYNILHASSDRIFYCNPFTQTLYCHNYSSNKMFPIELPSAVTSLEDGSMYVMCNGGSMYLVSCDGEHKVVLIKELKSEGGFSGISYNPTQKKLCIADRGIVKVFHEIQHG